tara:strand:+ start:307 stop:510 length:204 start_codon:yes stop_codon:yes gene_type:complete
MINVIDGVEFCDMIDAKVAEMNKPGMSWKDAVVVMEKLVAEHNSVIAHFPHPEIDKVNEAWARIQRG